MKTQFFVSTHPGKVRQQNEDVHLEDAELGLYAVADGVTHPRGRQVAEWACEEVKKYLRTNRAVIDRHAQATTAAHRQELAGLVRQALEHTSSVVYEKTKDESDTAGVFAALAVVLISRSFAFIAHAGDARVYSVREGAFHPLTRDHTYLASMLAEGKAFADARKVAYASNLFAAIGHQPVTKATLYVRELAPGERLLICSDGLSDYFGEGVITSPIANAKSKDIPKLLEEFALSHGGRDNVTALLLDIDGDSVLPEKNRVSPNVLVKLRAIRALRIFQHLDDDQLVGLLSFGDTRNYAEGDILIRKGVLIEEMYIVVNGEISVDVGQGAYVVEGKGAILGEMSLFDGGLPSATVTATKPTIVLVFSREALFSFMRENIGFAARFELGVLQAVIHRLRQRTEPDEESRVLENYGMVSIF
ncbi:MAG: cyclic nucleotide-binding domain-containing protein [Oligoflexia bacterium]|nr:cyclic nucleotide-binding domain-containing protein [Oligoflexia bacterium]